MPEFVFNSVATKPGSSSTRVSSSSSRAHSSGARSSKTSHSDRLRAHVAGQGDKGGGFAVDVTSSASNGYFDAADAVMADLEKRGSERLARQARVAKRQEELRALQTKS